MVRFARRTKGGGSLGRPRYLAIASWRGGRVVREAKALVPSAWDWACSDRTTPSRFLELATGRYRSPDPHLTIENGYILRRIAADARKVEWTKGGSGLTLQFLNAMGFDVGSIHAASEPALERVRADLARRPDGWLHDAAKTAAAAVEADYDAWRRGA